MGNLLQFPDVSVAMAMDTACSLKALSSFMISCMYPFYWRFWRKPLSVKARTKWYHAFKDLCHKDAAHIFHYDLQSWWQLLWKLVTEGRTPDCHNETCVGFDLFPPPSNLLHFWYIYIFIHILFISINCCYRYPMYMQVSNCFYRTASSQVKQQYRSLSPEK